MQGKPPLVAIVEDDDSVRRSTLRLLSCSGLRGEAYATAEEFLLSGRLEETDCVILDLRMPGMNGLQLQQRLADAARAVPIIFLSAQASPEEEREALLAGAVKFLHKPVGKEALLEAIGSALEGPSDKQNKVV